MSGLPFAGIRVIDFTHEWASTIAGKILGDFGAEVIKIEYVPRICYLRGARLKDRMYNRHPRWHQVNRNKRSLTLDLNRAEDLAAFRDLVSVSDIMINNSRPAVLEKFGLTYSELGTLKKDIILVTMTAYGATGPYASYAGFGATIEPLSGLQELTAYSREGRRYRIREMDVTNGLVGCCAVMTALLYRQRTGEGQYVDLSQMEAATHGLMGEHLLEYVMNRSQTLPLGNRHHLFAPQGCYPCKGEDAWVTITVRSDEEWTHFCKALGHPEWVSDSRFATGSARRTHHDELDHLIAAWTGAHTDYEAMHLLQAAGVPAGAVLRGKTLPGDPHLKARNYFIAAENDPSIIFPGMFARLSKTPGRLFRRGPDLGQDNEYIRCKLLGQPKESLRPIREEDVGTSFDPE